jgi:peptidoglycan/xylan/chitin deacetylase (PgdA/CDA1 family)
MLKIYHCFPGGRHKVLTLSYDDGKIQDRRLVALFNQYGLKATFHLNSGLMEQPERIPAAEIKTLYQGHEVAAHTLTHPTISRCPLDQVAQQIIADRKNLEVLVGYPVRGLSYPNGSYSQAIKTLLPRLGIEYSRIVGGTNQFTMPEDLLEWQATCHHRNGLMERAREFAALCKTQYFYMMYVWGHSFNFDDDHNWNVIEEFCQFISGRDDIWYATNIEIVDYLNALNRLKFSVSGQIVYNPSARPVWISVDDQVVAIKGGAQIELG